MTSIPTEHRDPRISRTQRVKGFLSLQICGHLVSLNPSKKHIPPQPLDTALESRSRSVSQPITMPPLYPSAAMLQQSSTTAIAAAEIKKSETLGKVNRKGQPSKKILFWL